MTNTYNAYVRREGRWWVILLPELESGRVTLSKGGMSGRRIAKEIGRALVTVQKALKEAA